MDFESENRSDSLSFKRKFIEGKNSKEHGYTYNAVYSKMVFIYGFELLHVFALITATNIIMAYLYS